MLLINGCANKKKTPGTCGGVITEYLGGFQYESGQDFCKRPSRSYEVLLLFFPMAEGYVKNDSGVLSYVFQYKDHLGNVRVSYAKNPQNQVLEIIEENNYYPFGLKHKGYNDYLATNNKYKYNGKELQDELSLNLYDMEARNYDPAIGRFTSLDPITHYSQSPYSAFNSNPIYWADPSGMAGEHYNFQAGRYENDKGSQVTFGEAMASQGLNENGSEKTGDSNSSNSDATSSEAKINPKEAFEYQKKYPRTMQVLRQIRGYAKSNPDILKALSEFSGYSTMEILDILQYSNSSVLMEIRELQSLNKYSPEGLNNGSAAFRLSIENAEFLETLKTNAEIQAFSFFVAVTILHEFVHIGRINNKMPEPREMGWGWEERAYGRTVNGDSYKEVYKSSNWNFKDNNYKYKLAPLF